MSEWIQLDIEEWISSQEDSPVSPTVSQESKTQTTIANSGLKCLELSKKSDPPTSLERMSEILLASETEWYSSRCVLTWKVKATKCRRLYYLLQQSTLRTKDTGAGFFHTPNTMDSLPPRSEKALRKQYEKSRMGRKEHATLREQVVYPKPEKMWPTPRAIDGIVRHSKKWMKKRIDEKRDVDLTTAVKMWPTPAAHEGRLGYQRRDTGKKGTQKSLTTIVIDSQGGREKTTGQLNPQWVEWLMGYPIGWTDLKD